MRTSFSNLFRNLVYLLIHADCLRSDYVVVRKYRSANTDPDTEYFTNGAGVACAKSYGYADA